jgi:hypothetical protein
MAETQIADQRVDSDGRRKTDESRQTENLPEIPRRLAAPDAEKDQQAAPCNRASESCAVVVQFGRINKIRETEIDRDYQD